MQKNFVIPARQVPVHYFDVAVVGGGTGGVIAAIAAARTGARTVLIESKGYLGGTVVEGGTALHSFFNNWKTFGREKVQLVRGIPSELVDRVTAMGGCTGHCEMSEYYQYDAVCTAIDVETYKLAAHSMAEEAGVTLFLNTVMMENGKINALTISNHAGVSAVRADCFVDATGYGDLCAAAGAAFTEPNDKSISAPIGVAGVDMDKYAAYVAECGARADVARGLRDGEPDGIVRVCAHVNKMPEDFKKECREIGMSMQITSTHKDYFMFVKLDYKLPVSPTDRDAMSAAELELRRRQVKAVELIRKYIPGCEHAYIARSTPAACIRRGRCIVCDYDLTNEDVTSGRHFEDDVFDYGFHDEAPFYNIAEGGSYGFPYRAMLPQGMDNLFATGMMVTSDHHAHMSTRNTVSCMAQGEAAGTAAALCAMNRETTRGLSYRVLRRKLLENGVYLSTEPEEAPKAEEKKAPSAPNKRGEFLR